MIENEIAMNCGSWVKWRYNGRSLNWTLAANKERYLMGQRLLEN